MAQITATDLQTQLVYSNADPLLLDGTVSSVKPGDFAGLNLAAVLFQRTNIKEMPARIFDGVSVRRVDIYNNEQLESFHPQTFEGIEIPTAPSHFALFIHGASKLTADTDSIPPTLFDPIGDQGFTADKPFQELKLQGSKLTHINTRWFASMVKSGGPHSGFWGYGGYHGSAYVNLTDSSANGIIDTYYYDDGTGRFTDGTKTIRGEVGITSSTTRQTLGDAISAEILRYANDPARPGSTTYTLTDDQAYTATRITDFGPSSGADNTAPLQVDRTLWGSVDICQRTPQVRDRILTELRTEQPTIYGTAADHTSGTYSVTTGFGCTGNTESAIVTKANLTAHTDWGISPNGLDVAAQGITKLRFDDFWYLDAEEINLAGNPGLEYLPDRLFQGLSPCRIQIWGPGGLRAIGKYTFHGIVPVACTTGVVLTLEGHKLTDVSIHPEAFDPWAPELEFVNLSDNLIGRINTRWFERMTELGTLGWGGLRFRQDSHSGRQENPTVSYFYNDTGGYYDSGATSKVNYDATLTAGASPTATSEDALRTAIKARITAYAAATTGVTDNSDLAGTKFHGPRGWGVDVCGRNEAVWKELMRQFYAIRTAPPTERGPAAYQAPLSNVGDIRFDRYNDITVSNCEVLEAQWVNQTTGNAVPDQSAYNTATDTLAILNDANNNSQGQHQDNFRLDGADLSTLTAADMQNFHDVRRLWLNGTGLENVSPDLFAHMPKLTHLYLDANKLDTADFTSSPNFLAPLGKLEFLNLNNNLINRFDSDWLNSDAKTRLRQLWLDGNPIAKTDLSGLNLSHLGIAQSSITQFDPAIAQMSNLVFFSWWELRAMPAEEVARFIPTLPSAVQISIPGGRVGNLGDLEDSDIDAAATALQIAHNARLSAINSAAGGNQVTLPQLYDPCRPLVEEAGGRAAWANADLWGPLCLTSAQKDAWLNGIDDFAGGDHFIVRNTDFTDAQMAAFLGKLAALDNVGAIQVAGNPNAFGAGFNDAALSAFREFDDLWLLRLKHHDLTNAQAKTMLDNLEYALGTDPTTFTDYTGTPQTARGGLVRLDLSFNPNLFKEPDSSTPPMMVQVDADELNSFLTGIFSHNELGVGIHLNLRATDINFDQLRAVIGSIELGSTPTDLSKLRTLNVSDNPNVWKRDNAGTWEDVGASEITNLLARLDGLLSFHAGNTGIDSDAKLTAVFNGLNKDPGTDKRVDPRDTSALKRLNEISLSGNDLGAIGSLAPLAGFDGRIALQNAPLTHLWLADTNINLADLTAIANALGAADLLDGITNLDLSGNPDIFTATSCPDGTRANSLSMQLARFTNLRYLSIADAEVSFTELKCVIHGLNAGDDNTADDLARNAVFLNLRDNAGLFSRTAQDGTRTEEPAADVAQALLPLRNARTNLAKTGFTRSQASEVAKLRAEGLEGDEAREALRSFANQNPVPELQFQTPLPGDLALQSGRGSLRVSFTHNPMLADGTAVTILRYEYRYRVRPSDPTDDWGTTGNEAWRTASLTLTTGAKLSFDIFGLEPETNYQLQLRATSVGRPSLATLSQGTTISLPEINEIRPGIREVNIRAGDQVRLEVDIYGLADILDNELPDADGSKIIFTWSDSPSGGTFSAPNDKRRVTYTAPALPGTYEITAEAAPDGICNDHHNTDFGISPVDREKCKATFIVRVSRAQITPDREPDPVNPAGPIPSSLTDSEGTAYTVFTPVGGGTYTGEGITVSVAKGAVPDQTLLGVSATVSATQAPEATPGARMTIAGSLYDIKGVSANGQPVAGLRLDDPLQACLPLPEAFRANISDIVLVEAKEDGNFGILSSKLQQSAGVLNVCGAVSTLPTTVGVAKLGVVVAPPATPVPEVETPDTGATAPSTITATLTLALGATLLLAIMVLAATETVGRLRRRPNIPTLS